MTVHYVETSALLSIALEGNVKLSSALSAAPSLITSSLTFVEFERALLRRRADGTLTAAEETKARRWARSSPAFATSWNWTAMSWNARSCRSRSSLFARWTLHLACVELLARKMGWLIVVAFDDRVRQNALALSFNVLPPPR